MLAIFKGSLPQSDIQVLLGTFPIESGDPGKQVGEQLGKLGC